jgi:hypothetical protein
MQIKLSVFVLLAMVPSHARAASLTAAEAEFLDQLVIAAAVLEQRCTGFEANGAGAVQHGARLLGSADAAMEMIAAFDAAIKAHDGEHYDRSKFRPEVAEVAGKIFSQARADLVKNPKAACADYGEASMARGLLRRY